MADFLTKEERSHRMSLIRSKNTTPEKQMASLLRKSKIKFRRYTRDLPGTPDFRIKDTNVVVFCDGDFWHGRNFGQWRGKLSSWWQNKIANNKKRDARVNACLRKRGFKVVHCWERDIKRKPQACIKRIKKAIGE